MATHDIAVIGGGLVGAAIAFGLTRQGLGVAVFDEGDIAYRASRGNFGLVWVQGKGLNHPNYIEWSLRSSERWSSLAAELHALTDIDVELRQPGGVYICADQQEFEQRRALLERLRTQSGGRFEFKMLDHQALAERVPAIGPEVAGASWSDHDGHANPLYLLRALHLGLGRQGGRYLSGAKVVRVSRDGDGYRIERADGETHHAARVVLAAGLGNVQLAPQLGLHAPLKPNRGEVIITERVAPLLDIPTHNLRQTGDGTLQLGDSHEDAGFDDGTRVEVLKAIVRRNLRLFPRLASVRMVRAWGALRVMPPDGLPIYQASRSHPGAFIACCHSGVTLAAMHAGPLADWIAGGPVPDQIASMSAERFDAHTTVVA
ncbi:NAD(P)/FAD-dependent oxidoreductase [Halotalea alkalilenta]|uniref:NAD(P)/FAD-dependent oxidoreductase n=1 Tax=Halotalea alkalilenta TaxID=376489 RepID=UPI0004812503|nr:FAD-dependent oxidoreductase [Halotalea alkalilenta]